MNHRFLLNSGIVATTIGIDDRAALHIKVSLLQHRFVEACFTDGNDLTTLLDDIIAVFIC